LIGLIVFGVLWAINLPYYILIAVGLLFWKSNSGRMNFGKLHGSARWARAPQLQADGYFGDEGLLLGRYREHGTALLPALTHLVTGPLKDSDAICRGFITSLTKGHINLLERSGGAIIRVPMRKYVNLITVAPAGAGKGVGTVVPNLLQYPYSVIVTDLKGENFALTAAQRKAMGQRIVVLDPFSVSGSTSATFNPLDLIAVNSPTLMEDVRSLADALVIRTAKDNDPHWNESAINLLYAVILLVAVECKGEERNLDKVRLTLSNQEELKAALEFMKGSDALEGMLARAAGTILSMPEKEFGSVLSSANRHTNFLDSPLIRANMVATSFDVRTIAKRPTSLYLILPAQYIQSHARLMLLWITSLLLVVKQAGASEQHEILFMLDEVAQLGEVQSLEQAITLLRGFGLRLWFIVQSLSQLEVAFPGPRAKVILANCGIQQFFGVSDIDTATYISKYIGTETLATPNYQAGTNWGSSQGENSRNHSSGRSRGVSHGSMSRELIKPEEILRERNGVFILQQGRDPILGSRLTYYDDPDLDPEPMATGRGVSKTSWIFAALGAMFLLNFLGQYVQPRAWISRMFTSAPNTHEQAKPPEFRKDVDPEWFRKLTTGTANPPTRSADRSQLPPPLPEPPKPPAGPIIATCPNCKKRDTLPDDYNGQELTCPTCNASFIVPLSR
jgi:type IV secretion system protein VirD4